MRHYRAFGRCLASEIDLPELMPLPVDHGQRTGEAERAATVDGAAALVIESRAKGASLSTCDGTDGDGGWTWHPTQDRWLQLASGPAGYRLRLAEVADFFVSPDCRVITPGASCGLDEDTWRHLLIDQVLPIVLSAHGVPLLHGAALAFDDEAVALVGPTGRGKSTLSAYLGQSGAAVLTDDSLGLDRGDDGWMAWPSYAGIRVWPDVLEWLGGGRPVAHAPRVAAYSDKRRLGPSQPIAFRHAPAPLRRIYLLQADQPDEPAIAPIATREAAMGLLSQAFVLDPSDGARLARQFEWVCALAESVVVKTLSYRRTPAMLPLVARAIRTDLDARDADLQRAHATPRALAVR